MPPSRLVLGGHSFIEQLGSDRAASETDQVAIVERCLDNGITCFDTTYQPERVALGRALARLGRRREATIIAWNFFTDFAPGGQVGGPSHFQPHHIELMLSQLQTTHIDLLVVHAMGNPDQDLRQEQLAHEWVRQGLVGKLGTWYPGADAATVYGRSHPCSFMVRPYNITTADAAPAFAACKSLGWQNFACSPFVRGWELDKLTDSAASAMDTDRDTARTRLADLMLRYALFAPDVDRLIVAVRRPELVRINRDSESRGPLTPPERALLEKIRDTQR